MAQVKAKVLQTTAGAYGLAQVDDEIVLDEKHAKELEEKGVIKILGAATGADKEKRENSFRITDNTGTAKEKAEQDTDETDPTGQKEKSENAGPNPASKKGQETAATKKAASKGRGNKK